MRAPGAPPLRHPLPPARPPCQVLFEETKGDAIVTTGVGQHQMWAAQFYRFAQPRRWVTSGGLGSMGFGLPSALGAAAAFDGRDGTPKRVVVDIDGDGSFVMNCQVGGGGKGGGRELHGCGLPGARAVVVVAACCPAAYTRQSLSRPPSPALCLRTGAGHRGRGAPGDQVLHPEQPAPGHGGAVGGPLLQGQPRAHLPGQEGGRGGAVRGGLDVLCRACGSACACVRACVRACARHSPPTPPYTLGTRRCSPPPPPRRSRSGT